MVTEGRPTVGSSSIGPWQLLEATAAAPGVVLAAAAAADSGVAASVGGDSGAAGACGLPVLLSLSGRSVCIRVEGLRALLAVVSSAGCALVVLIVESR